MPTGLLRAPGFIVARSEVGALAADGAILSDANYPVAQSIAPHGGYPTVLAYWYAAAGVVNPADFVNLQLLFRDVQNAGGARWTEGPIEMGVPQNKTVTFNVQGCTEVYLRVHSLVCAAGTGLVVMAACGPYVA